MGKPLIILCDTDTEYLSPLELKFVEELDEKADIEVITDRDYFNTKFSQPQTADVLIISPAFYSNDLQKHNIKKIFLLTENDEDGGTEDLNIEKIKKYSSAKEIYNQIVAVSGISKYSPKSKDTIVILIYSASGGTGKTTLAIGLCKYLSQNYKKVLYVNAERMNSFQYLIKNQTPMPNSVNMEFSNHSPDLFKRISHIIRNESFDYLPPFGVALSSMNLDFSIYEKIIESAKLSKKYDVIVVDTDSVFDNEKASLITKSDKVFIVLDQTKKSVVATNSLLKNINCSDSEKYYFICNRFNSEMENALVSTNNNLDFTVNEYVENFEKTDMENVREFWSKIGIQKIAYLII